MPGPAGEIRVRQWAQTVVSGPSASVLSRRKEFSPVKWTLLGSMAVISLTPRRCDRGSLRPRASRAKGSVRSARFPRSSSRCWPRPSAPSTRAPSSNPVCCSRRGPGSRGGGQVGVRTASAKGIRPAESQPRLKDTFPVEGSWVIATNTPATGFLIASLSRIQGGSFRLHASPTARASPSDQSQSLRAPICCRIRNCCGA